MAKAKAEKKAKGTHGGARAGTGKPTYFRGKDPNAYVILLRSKTKKLLEKRRSELKGMSRSDFIEALLVLHGPSLTIDDVASIADN